MPVYGGSSASGKQKKRKVKRRKDSGTGNIPNAVTGGKGVKKSVSKQNRFHRTQVELEQMAPRGKKGQRVKARKIRQRAAARAYRQTVKEQATARKIERKANEQVALKTTKQVIREANRSQDDDSSLGEDLAGTVEGLKKVGTAVAETLSAKSAQERGAAVGRKVREGDIGGAIIDTLPELAAAVPLGRAALLAKTGGRLGKAKKTADAARSTAKSISRNKAKTAPKTKTKTPKQKPRTRDAKNKVKGRGKQALDKTKTRYGKPGRKARSKERQHSLASVGTHPGTALGTISEPGQAFVEGTAEAVKPKNIGKTAKTTGRALYSFPAAVAGDVADLATGHVGEFVESQKEYVKSLKPLVSGDPEKVAKAIEEDVGLVPHLTAALGGVSAGRILTGGKSPSLPSISNRKVRRNVKQATEGKTPEARMEAKNRIDANREGEPLSQRRRGKRREAERSAVAAEEEMGLRSIEMRKGGKRRPIRKRRVEEDVRRLDRKQVAPGVTQGDVLNFLSRHRDASLDDVKAIRRDMRDSTRPIDTDSKHTRKVVDAIVDNPELLASTRIKATVARIADVDEGRRVARHSERTGRQQSTPDPMDERARLLPYAREKDILLPEERPMRGVKTKVRPRRGQDFAKAVRGEAKSFRQRAKRLEDQASSQRRKRPERARELEERAELYRLEAEAREAIVSRFKRADGLEKKAATASPAESRRMMVEAQQLRAQALQDQDAIRGEFVEDVNQSLAEAGRGQPVMLPQRDVTRVERTPASGVPATRGAKKEKFRSGTLEEQGRIDESAKGLLESLYRTRSTMTERGRQRGFIDETALRVDGQRFLTGEEITAARRAGKVKAGWEQVPLQDFAAAIQRNDALRAEVNARRLKAQGEGGEARLYALVPRSQLKEFRAQSERLGGGWRTVRATTRSQAVLMLAGSVPWFIMQVPATIGTMALRNPNPARWVRAARKGIDLLRHATPEERAAFWAHFGGNPSDFLAIGENVRGINPTSVKSFGDAATLALRSPMGRLVNAVGQNIRKGGPLIATNRAFEAQMRKFDALLEMDRLSGVSASGRPRAFAAATSHLSSLVFRHLDQLKGKNSADQMRAYLNDGRLMRELDDAVNRSYGNWSALTATEKKAASVATFLPFLRFSLRWIAQFPKDNPLKTAVYINLGQQNAQELSLLLGGDPSFWTGWGKAVTHVGGEPSLVDLSRAMPGGNALVEAVAGDMNIVQTGLRATAPLIGGTIAAGLGKDQFGRDLPEGMSFEEQTLKNLLNLSPVTRAKAQQIGPEPSNVSKLFRELEDRSGLERALLPDAFPDIAAEAEAIRLSNLLNRAYADDGKDSDKAWNEIDKMLIAYGVETKKTQRQDYKKAIEEKYGKPKPSGIFGGNTFGGDIFEDSSSGSSIFK